MMLVDVHAHLDHFQFRDDLADVIGGARKAGVKAIITNGINPETNRTTLKIAEKFGIVKPALGIYPPKALQREIEQASYPFKPDAFNADVEIRFIEKNRDNIIAVGEVGLDYESGAKGDGQEELFHKMVALAMRIKKPVIVHSRKAEEAVFEILCSSAAKKVLLHCFCGKKSLIKRAADKGYFFSIPTNIVRAHNFQMLTGIVNISQLLTETDAPYLSPYRGRRNEPAFVIESVKKIAEIKKMSIEEVANNIFMNYENLFL